MSTDKKDRILNAPDLRFPEFIESWEACRFEDVCHITTGNKNTQDKEDDGMYPFYVRSQQVERINNYTFDGEAILTAGDGVGVGKVFHHTYGKIGVHQRVYILSDFKCDGRYLFYYFSANFYDRVKRMSAKNSVDSVRYDMIAKMKLWLPEEIEQQKIGTLLSLLDKRIETQSRAIEKLQSLISGITQKVSKHPSIQKTMLSDVLTERNEKNQRLLPVYSVSVSEGVVNQVEYLGRSFAAKDTSNYNVVHFGDIVYTKSPTGDFPFGIVKRSNTTDDVAVSPLYGVYQPSCDDIGIYLHYYFCSSLNTKNYLHKLIQKGAKNTINITNQRFLENEVPIPDPNTLHRYVVLMTSLSKKLEQEKNLLVLLQTQKQFLLREMFI